jgi:hypothetical protein
LRFGATPKATSPRKPTICRPLQWVDAHKVQQAIQAIQQQVRAARPKNELVVLDSQEPKHGSGTSVLNALTRTQLNGWPSSPMPRSTNWMQQIGYASL